MPAAYKLYPFIFIIIFLFISKSLKSQDFAEEQRRYPRVRSAFLEKDSSLRAHFDSLHFEYPPSKIFIRIFKYERIVELWGCNVRTDTFKISNIYKFCSTSGDLGPKRREVIIRYPKDFIISISLITQVTSTYH